MHRLHGFEQDLQYLAALTFTKSCKDLTRSSQKDLYKIMREHLPGFHKDLHKISIRFSPTAAPAMQNEQD